MIKSMVNLGNLLKPGFKKHLKKAGDAAQGEEPVFKTQYHKKVNMFTNKQISGCFVRSLKISL